MRSSGALRRGLFLLLLSAPVALAVAVDLPLCPLAAVLGVPCPGCGLTRAGLAALRGDFAHALALHPLIFWVGPIYVLVVGGMLLGWVRGSSAPAPVAADGAAGPPHARAQRVLLSRVVSVLAALTIALLLAVWLARFAGWFGGPVPVESLRTWRARQLPAR